MSGNQKNQAAAATFHQHQQDVVGSSSSTTADSSSAAVAAALLPHLPFSGELEELRNILHFPEEVALRLTDSEYQLFNQVRDYSLFQINVFA